MTWAAAFRAGRHLAAAVAAWVALLAILRGFVTWLGGSDDPRSAVRTAAGDLLLGVPYLGTLVFGLPILLTVGLATAVVLRRRGRDGPPSFMAAGAAAGVIFAMVLVVFDDVNPIPVGARTPYGPMPIFHGYAGLFLTSAWTGALHGFALWGALRVLTNFGRFTTP